MTRKKLTREERTLIHSKTNQRCGYCGDTLKYKDMQVDHIHPFSQGGSDKYENLIAACRSCNHYKSTLSIENFRTNIGKWLDRLSRDNVTYKNAVRYGLVIPNPKPIKFYFENIEEED